MSDNYRSRTERNHVKIKSKKQIKKKPKKKAPFKKIPYRLSTSWYRWSCSWRFRFVMVKDAPKLDKSKLVNPLSTKFLDKDGNFSMNTVLKTNPRYV